MKSNTSKARLNVENLKPREVVKVENKTQEKPKKKKSKYTAQNDPFIIRSAKERMIEAMNLSTPKRLIGDLLYENTFIFLYADTGVGKSVLAVQMAECIARGENLGILENDSEPQKVLYVDIENGPVVMKVRYTEMTEDDRGKHYVNPYEWSDNLSIVDLKSSLDYDSPSKYDYDYWLHFIGQTAEKEGVKVIFIDNLMSIITEGDGIESTKETNPFLNGIKRLKEENNYTIVVVHHAIKKSPKDAIYESSLAGSANLSRLSEGVIAVGKSNYDFVNQTNDSKKGNSSARYIKSVKPNRLGQAAVYDEYNVITARIEKIKPNFTGFNIIELPEDSPYFNESEHLKNPFSADTVIHSQVSRNETLERVKELLKQDPSLSYREMEKTLKEEGKSVSHVTIGNYVKQLEIELINENNV